MKQSYAATQQQQHNRCRCSTLSKTLGATNLKARELPTILTAVPNRMLPTPHKKPNPTVRAMLCCGAWCSA